jgi:aminoglycoside phosphotransferase (APT) family kinase protein
VITVTVNTVIIGSEEIDDRLRAEWPGVTPGDPAPLAGGFWATMYRVPVSGQPDGIATEVVVRFAPHRAMGAKEAEVQRAIAATGFPTPPVWLSAADDVRDGWWSVMDFSPGAPLLAGLDGGAAVRRAPSLLRTLPAQLATVAAALHHLDPGPVSTAVRAAAPTVAWSTAEVLDQLRLGAEAVRRADVLTALDRLAIDQPASGGEVVCHGDLHPFNVLQDGGDLVVLDWTGAVRADPCFDLAFTELLLANPPLALPAALRPVGRFAGRLLARRFVAAYARASPDADLGPLWWFRGLHCARVLVEAERLRAEHGPDGGGHPFVALAPVAAHHLEAASGVGIDR